MNASTHRPPILYGAVTLAVLSLAWSGYAIADLMHSGPFGLSVALAGDVGWITVLWAEYKGITIGSHRWAAPVAGWLIALGVAVLLVIHGSEAGGRAQAVAGPFVVLVGKTVWAFALAAMKDPTAPTPEQQAEIHSVMRDSSYTAQLHEARADAEIARIRAEARTTLARDDADFEVTLERVRKRAELTRRAPLALTAAGHSDSFDRAAEEAVRAVSGQPDRRPDTVPDTSGHSDAVSQYEPPTSTDTHPDSPDAISVIARSVSGPSDLVRALLAHRVRSEDIVSEAARLRPDISQDSVRRTLSRIQKKAGPYL